MRSPKETDILRVVFVDDDLLVLAALRRHMQGMKGEWNMAFYSTAIATLSALAFEPADVIVSDMRMPGMDSAQLLAEVERLYPRTIRFMLSATALPSDRGPAHQYFSKSCDISMLHAAITQLQL